MKTILNLLTKGYNIRETVRKFYILITSRNLEKIDTQNKLTRTLGPSSLALVSDPQFQVSRNIYYSPQRRGGFGRVSGTEGGGEGKGVQVGGAAPGQYLNLSPAKET